MTDLERQDSGLAALCEEIRGTTDLTKLDMGRTLRTLLAYIDELKSANQHLREGMENLASNVIDGTARIEQLQRRIKQIEEDHLAEIRDARDELREVQAEARWQDRQGDEYGSY